MALSDEELKEKTESLRKTLTEMGVTEEDQITVLAAAFVQGIPRLYPNRSIDPRPYHAMDSVRTFFLMRLNHRI